MDEEEVVTSSQDQPPTSSIEEEEEGPLLLHHHRKPNSKKLALLPLVFLIFFEVSGGPYGEEPTVGSAGPLWAILGFLVFPFVWSLPEALVTAELATAFPGNGGFVLWAHNAFGPFWAHLMGSWKFFTGVLNLASYPVLTLDYAKLVFPSLSSGTPRLVAVLLLTCLLSLLNYTGLAVVGHTAVALGFISLSPFLLLTLACLPKIEPGRWLSLGQEGVQKDWTIYFNTLFWNLNFWDSASTLAGEVDEPRRTFPKALFAAGLLTCVGYVVPLLAATGALPLDQAAWTDGYLADVAEAVAGKWLKYYMEVAAALSVVGLYEAQLSSCAYQLLGMADLRMLPALFGSRSRHFNTPWVGILLSTGIALVGSLMDFTEIISAVNFLYSLGMLLEFAAFLWLRRKKGEVARPFRVGLGLPGLVAMCLVPSGFLVYVMAMGTRVVYLVGGGLTLAGIGWYWFVKLCKSKMWLEFNGGEDNL